MDRQTLVLGWNEYIDLPEWGIRGIKAKIDTGARSSSLHVEDIKKLPSNRISFNVVLNKKTKRKKKVIAHIHRRSKVKSSLGSHNSRIFVVTKIKVGPIERKVELNLVDRGDLIFRMLLGRSALSHHFIIDVSHTCLLGKK